MNKNYSEWSSPNWVQASQGPEIEVETIWYSVKYSNSTDNYVIKIRNGTSTTYACSLSHELVTINKADAFWYALREIFYKIYGHHFKDNDSKLKTIHGRIMNEETQGTISFPKTSGHLEYGSIKHIHPEFSIYDKIYGYNPIPPKKDAQGFSDLSLKLPGMMQMENHPITNHHDYLRNIIMSLNDQHKWTRDQIADWIESLDNVPVFEIKENT